MAAVYDVVGLGNAIVDVIAKADEDFLTANGLVKNAMRLISAEEADELYGKMGPGLEMSGGSAGNTMAALASLGGKGVFVGKVAHDQLGKVYRHDIRAAGVVFDTADLTDGKPTGSCLILVTPDGHRTMNTFLGACLDLTPDDIDAGIIQSSKVVYMEGYLWDPPAAKQAFLKAAALAHAAGRKVALSLSDPFCVNRHLESFQDLVKNHVDILFANESEIVALFGGTFDSAAAEARRHVEVAVLTRGDQGATVLVGDQSWSVPAEKVEKVVDTTGAGDLFAAGFLYGYTQGRDPADCARLGAICAGEIIGHYGARSEVNLAELVKSKGL